MTAIVTENCTRCRFTECVDVCPVECFHADDTMVYIDPDVCVDCGACAPECPVEAIYDEIDLPASMNVWAELNATRSKSLPLLTARQAPHRDAERRKQALGF